MRRSSTAPRVEAETARLYRQYEPQILRYCRRHMRSREDAEDAAQTTFLRAFGALRRGFEPELEVAWLYKIAHNVCVSKALSAQRRARVESPADVQALEERLAAPESSTDELFELGDVLEGMPERLRTAILLREWQGLSYAEIADKLGTSRSAVETLIFRARRYLAGALDDSTAKLRQVIALAPVAALLRGLVVRFGAAKLAAGAVVSATALAGGGIAAHDIISRPSKPSGPAHASTPRTPSAALAGSRRSGSAQPTHTRRAAHHGRGAAARGLHQTGALHGRHRGGPSGKAAAAPARRHAAHTARGAAGTAKSQMSQKPQKDLKAKNGMRPAKARGSKAPHASAPSKPARPPTPDPS